MHKIFQLTVSYSQIAIFPNSTRNPFSNWEKQHVLQGFAWRSDSTSFRTIVDAAVYDVEIYVLNKQGLVRKNAVRVIEVPFTIPPNEAIEVASISDAFNLNLPPGKFLLRCEFLDKKTPGVEHVIFTFSVQDAPKYAVLVADELITVTSNFLIDACAAGS